jgi:hypothetical protein
VLTTPANPCLADAHDIDAFDCERFTVSLFAN